MSELEKFEKINMLIGYKINKEQNIISNIFTQEFMDLFKNYYYKHGNLLNYKKEDINTFGIGLKTEIMIAQLEDLFNNLDNPVEYLYNLIFTDNETKR